MTHILEIPVASAREKAMEDRKRKLKDFIAANYADYYGILIFRPTTMRSEFIEDANRMWLIKNNIEVEITL